LGFWLVSLIASATLTTGFAETGMTFSNGSLAAALVGEASRDRAFALGLLIIGSVILT
jgi:hypothetical protein